jgi:hypothetical protein
MPSHAWIGPQDLYAEAGVLVQFRTMADGVHLVSARDASDDILPDLEAVHCRALENQILGDFWPPG